MRRISGDICHGEYQATYNASSTLRFSTSRLAIQWNAVDRIDARPFMFVMGFSVRRGGIGADHGLASTAGSICGRGT
jgi:hypothetical protein